MKLPTTNVTYVSDSDACVISGARFPRGCRIPNLQIPSTVAEKNDTLPEGVTVKKRVHLSMNGYLKHQEGAEIRTTGAKTHSLYIHHSGRGFCVMRKLAGWG